MMRYAIAYHEVNGKGFSSTEPYIYDEFGNSSSECLSAASDLIDKNYKLVTPFIINDKMETYNWMYVNNHKLIQA